MKIYTKKGDRGETGLLDGVRTWKNDPRLEVCGSLDELNAVLGLIRAEGPIDEVDQLLNRIQHELFHAGAELATIPPASSPCETIGEEHARRLEQAIDRFEADLPAQTGFILPGGCRAAALFHVARTTCRRAERFLVALLRHHEHAVSEYMSAYLNRLSDLLYILARHANFEQGMPDIPWKKHLDGESA